MGNHAANGKFNEPATWAEALSGLQVIVGEELPRVAGEGHALRSQTRQAEAEVVVLEDLGDLAPGVPGGVPHEEVAEVGCTHNRYTVWRVCAPSILDIFNPSLQW